MIWKEYSIGDLCKFVRNGKSIKQSKDAGGLPITRIETIWNAEIDDTRVGHADLDEGDASKYLLEKGDILLSHINSLAHMGKCAIYEGHPSKLVHGMNLLCLRPKKNLVFPKFFLYLLRTNYFNANLLALTNKSVNQASISATNLKSIKVKVPSLAEQQRIAAILDKADALRAKRRVALAKLDTLLQATFLDMFGDPVTNPKGWETFNMGDVIIDGPQNGLYRPASDYGSGTPIVRIDSFYNGKVIGLDQLKRVRLDPETKTKFAVQKDDILINRVNSREYLGKTAIVPSLNESTVFESNMMRLTINNNLLMPQYLVSLMQHDYIKIQIMSRCKDAVNQSSINQQDVKSFELRVPPLDIQKKYICAFNKVEALQRKLLLGSQTLEALFNSLQQRAFKGEL